MARETAVGHEVDGAVVEEADIKQLSPPKVPGTYIGETRLRMVVKKQGKATPFAFDTFRFATRSAEIELVGSSPSDPAGRAEERRLLRLLVHRARAQNL